MTTPGLNFLYAWLDVHMAEFTYSPDNHWRAKFMADQLRDDAVAEGIHPNEIEEKVGNVEVIIFQAMQSDGRKEVADRLLAARKTPPSIH